MAPNNHTTVLAFPLHNIKVTLTQAVLYFPRSRALKSTMQFSFSRHVHSISTATDLHAAPKKRANAGATVNLLGHQSFILHAVLTMHEHLSS